MQVKADGFVPKEKLEILDQMINDELGMYRLQAADRVHYLTILCSVFDSDTMGIPYLLIPQLPDIPDSDWTRMSLSRGADGNLVHEISSESLPQLSFTFHTNMVDILSLHVVSQLRPGVHEVIYKGQPAIAKYRCFDWEFYRIQQENWAYAILEDNQDHCQPPIAPRVLGHLTENGRPIGLLLEKIEGRSASIKDLQECEKAIRALHAEPLFLIHGDVNRFNFVVNVNDGRVRLVDFEHAEDYDEEKGCKELESLPRELTEETGRGGVVWGDEITDNFTSD